ncbi:MAG: serine hydrolase [Alcanivoracaceae bacterium]|nr:serine hydrolase [Alcanivoracaceae bacterium]
MKLKLSILILLFSSFCYEQSLQQIDQLIEKEMKSDQVAAIVVAVIDFGEIVHLRANGFRDLEKKTKASINTPFHIASVSKTVL